MEDHLSERQDILCQQGAITTDVETLEHLTIGEIINRERFKSAFRERFRSDPILNYWTLKDLLDLETRRRFLETCRRLPQFGAVQEIRLQLIIHELCSKADRSDVVAGYKGMASNKSRRFHRNDPESSTGQFTRFSLSGDFYPCFVSAWKAVYQRAWQLAHFDDFIYIPSSVPEFAKHPDVMRAEVGRDVDIDDYMARSSALGASLSAVSSATGVVLLDEARLDMIFKKTGCYSRLKEASVAQQRQMLIEISGVLPSGVELQVCDIEANGLSCCSVIGDLVTMAVMGGYLVTQHEDLRALISQRCGKAISKGRSIQDYLSGI